MFEIRACHETSMLPGSDSDFDTGPNYPLPHREGDPLAKWARSRQPNGAKNIDDRRAGSRHILWRFQSSRVRTDVRSRGQGHDHVNLSANRRGFGGGTGYTDHFRSPLDDIDDRSADNHDRRHGHHPCACPNHSTDYSSTYHNPARHHAANHNPSTGDAATNDAPTNDPATNDHPAIHHEFDNHNGAGAGSLPPQIHWRRKRRF